MSAQQSSNPSSTQITQRIWTLAGCAIAGGVLVLAMVVGHGLRSEQTAETVRAQRQELRQITDELDPALTTLGSSHQTLFRRRGDATTAPAAEVAWSPGRQRISDLPAEVRDQLEHLDAEFAAGADEVAAGQRWLGRLGHLVEARRTAQQRGEGALQVMQTRVGQLAAVAPDAHQDTRRQLEQALHQLDKQLGLIGQQTASRRSAKLGQQMASTLDFIDGALEQLPASAVELRADQRRLRLALLGSRTPLSNSLTRTGYLEAHDAWLEATAEGAQLDRHLGDRIADLRAGRADLDRLMGDALIAAHAAVQARLRNLWLICLAISAVTLTLILIMVMTITRRAREQISGLVTDAREAGETAQAQARFLASMSHEIRTPMNGVLGMAEILETSDDLTDDHRQLARTIRSSSEALLTVINDVLDFSKIQAGKLELESAEFDLRAVIAESLELLTGLATERGNRLTHHIDHQVPSLLQGDPDRLRQILLNLTGNAIKFTRDGEVDVRIRLKNAHRDIVVLEATVRDTGVGMSDEAQSGLFKSFSQVGTTSSQRVAGTGLGLTISKRLIQLMGGDISVHSQPGEGSTFTFNLTLKRALRSKANDFSGHNVLIVSDDQDSWQELALQLLPWKLGLEIAESDEAALELLHSSRDFHLCLLDLPRAESMALARRIDEDEALASTHCMVLSADQAPRDERRQVDAWLTKPVDGDGLAQCLQSLLGQRDTGAGQAKPADDDGPLGYHVLVAEDNAINQRVLKEMLRRIGCTTEFAGDGRQVLALLQEHSYDAILMDCQMPEMDGFEATRAIRATPSLADLPVIALTANVMPADRRACEEAGMNDFLSKPVKKGQLRETIQRWAAPRGS